MPTAVTRAALLGVVIVIPPCNSADDTGRSACYPRRVERLSVGQKSMRLGRFNGFPAALVALLAIASADRAQATAYTLSSKDAPVVGEDQTVETVYQDTLYDLARKYGLGAAELIRG